MTTVLNPYIILPGRAREALEFYADVFGGEPRVITFSDMEGDGAPIGIVHSLLDVPGGTLMVADARPGSDHGPISGVWVSLSSPDEESLRGYWARLTDGGTVKKPLEEHPWGAIFGMCLDPFGVGWMINIAEKPVV